MNRRSCWSCSTSVDSFTAQASASLTFSSGSEDDDDDHDDDDDDDDNDDNDDNQVEQLRRSREEEEGEEVDEEGRPHYKLGWVEVEVVGVEVVVDNDDNNLFRLGGLDEGYSENVKIKGYISKQHSALCQELLAE